MSNRLIVSHCKCWHHKYGPSVFESKRASSENDLLTWVLLTGISTQWFDSFLFFYISVFTECIFYTETWCQIEDFVWNGLFVNFFFLLIRALQVSCREMGCLWRFCNLPYEHIYLIGLHIFFFFAFIICTVWLSLQLFLPAARCQVRKQSLWFLHDCVIVVKVILNHTSLLYLVVKCETKRFRTFLSFYLTTL